MISFLRALSLQLLASRLIRPLRHAAGLSGWMQSQLEVKSKAHKDWKGNCSSLTVMNWPLSDRVSISKGRLLSHHTLRLGVLGGVEVFLIA